MTEAPTTYRIGRFDLIPCEAEDRDSRGLIYMWEEPNPSAMYAIGCDPTMGITAWNRDARKQDDIKIDNGAIEVIRVGFGTTPDVQVAEYAAPIDPFELAEPLATLGNLFGGAHEDNEALVNIEIFPGPGLSTQRELINRFGYSNFFVHRTLDSMVPQENRVPRLGFYASNQSVRDLWVRGLRHIKKGWLDIKSPYLVEEMADCQPNGKGGYEAVGNAHDDRVRAMLLAIYGAHDWSTVIEPSEPRDVESDRKVPEFQATDISAADMEERWEEKFAELGE